MAENAAIISTTAETFRTEDELSIATSASVGILQLNDDCLQEIFGHLDLGGQLRLSMSSPRLTAAYQLYCRRRLKVLRNDDLNGVTLWEREHLFRFVGCYVEELIQLPTLGLPYKHCKRKHYVKLVNEFCPNVKRIYFEGTWIIAKSLRKLLAHMTEVTELHLPNCSLGDKAMLGVAELKKLEILNLRCNPGISSKHLWKLTNLSELNLSGCGIVAEHFIEMCKSLKQVKKLDIKACRTIPHEAFREIPIYCERLEQLKCSGHSRADVISRLKGLTLLCYESGGPIEPHGIRQIASLVNLVTISLAYCRSLQNAELLQILHNCAKLKNIDVCNCNHIDDEFVYDAIVELDGQLESKRRSQESVPVLVLVTKTRVTEGVLENSRYLAAKALLKLSFLSYDRYFRMSYSYSQDADAEDADFIPFR